MKRNRINKATWLILLLHITISSGIAQSTAEGNYIPPSPEASALLEYANIPVNLYTGTPSVNIPIYTFKGRNLEQDISLSYHASGIKVQDISSSVGLGWTLRAGGVITRIVRGLPDEHPNGYLNRDYETTTVFANYDEIEGGTIDAEPDSYFFNFSNYTGRMVMDQNGDALQIPERKFAISEPDFDDSNPVWVITDLEGIQYVFGKTSNERETTSSKLQYEDNSKLKTFISSWFLSEIISPYGDIMTFTYDNGEDISYDRYNQRMDNEIMSQRITAPCMGNLPYLAGESVSDYNTEITINGPKYISGISSPLGNVNFGYVDDREDIVGSLRLFTVEVKNMQNDLIKKIKLDNDQYFQSSGCSTALCKRLKLLGLFDETSETSLIVNQFGYNESVNLPSRNSVKTDYWGFYNNNTYSHGIPATADFYGNSYPGADKSPHEARTQANILTNITNAAGGYQELDYELNSYNLGGSATPIGGLRVSQSKERRSENSLDNEIVKTYIYTKEESGNTISSGEKYRGNKNDYELKIYLNCGLGEQYGQSILIRYANSLLDQYDIGGTHVGYSEVRIDYSDNSSEILEYTAFSDRPDEPATIGAFNSSNPVFSDPDGPPFISSSDRSFERGLIKTQTYYNNIGQELKKITNTYDYRLVSAVEVKGFRAKLLWTLGNTIYNRTGEYIESHRVVNLLSTKTELYDQEFPGNASKKITTVTDYDYDPVHLQLNKQTNYNFTEGKKYITEFKYAFDMANGLALPPLNLYPYASEGIWFMFFSNVLTPVEIINKQTENGITKIVGAQVNLYQRKWNFDFSTNDHDLFLRPSSNYLLKLDAPIDESNYNSITISGNRVDLVKDPNLELVHTFNKYDAYGNLQKETPKDGVVKTYEWGYNNNLLTASIINPGTNEQRTTYVHKPLVGVTQLTDPNGESTNYEYDGFNRLSIVRDDDNNILKRYRYHYKSQSEQLTANFAINGLPLINTSIGFTANSNAHLFGETRYLWDYGDGVVEEKTTHTSSHLYSQSGSYTVKLTVLNPDYESATFSKTTFIHSALATATICGPVSLDLCGIDDPIQDSCGPSPIGGAGQAVFTVQMSSGAVCIGSFQYQWKYKLSGSGSWVNFGNSSSEAIFISTQIGTHTIICEVTDACNNIYSGTSTVQLYRSQTNCAVLQEN